jgi:hypothetical protein
MVTRAFRAAAVRSARAQIGECELLAERQSALLEGWDVSEDQVSAEVEAVEHSSAQVPLSASSTAAAGPIWRAEASFGRTVQ